MLFLHRWFLLCLFAAICIFVYYDLHHHTTVTSVTITPFDGVAAAVRAVWYSWRMWRNERKVMNIVCFRSWMTWSAFAFFIRGPNLEDLHSVPSFLSL